MGRSLRFLPRRAAGLSSTKAEPATGTGPEKRSRAPNTSLIVALILTVLYVAQDRQPLPEPTEPPLGEPLFPSLLTATRRS